MELVLEVYLNNSKIAAKLNMPVGKGLIKVSDIIAVEKQDLKCMQTNIEYFVYRYPNTIDTLYEMVSYYLSQDFNSVNIKLQDLKKVVEYTKGEIIKNGSNHHTLKLPENMQKAMTMFDNELKTIALMQTFINENITKLKKYSMRSIKLEYKNKNEVMEYYKKLIKGADYEAIEESKKSALKKDKKIQGAFGDNSLSNRGTFEADI